MLREIAGKIVSNPRIYDVVQRLAGRDRMYRHLAPLFAETSGKTVLDVGGGTGELRRIIPPSATYVWLDNDAQKLSGLRNKFRGIRALLGNADQIALRDKSIDIGVCIAVSHHLTNPELSNTFRELARVCRLRLIFMDPIRDETSAFRRLLWSYDRGSFPRSSEELRSQIQQHFKIEFEEHYSIYHRYWICTATPNYPLKQARLGPEA
jgi:ubiquinone/menaquinone biosynthesis C-methylase UbiE